MVVNFGGICLIRRVQILIAMDCEVEIKISAHSMCLMIKLSSHCHWMRLHVKIGLVGKLLLVSYF